MRKTACFLLFGALCMNTEFTFADCPTGYACLLKDIKAQENVIQNIREDSIDKFFKPQLKEPKLKNPDNIETTRPPTYQEIMIFVPRNF